MENYLIVLFDNKVKQKIVKKYITFKKAKQYFEKCLSDSNDVIFEQIVKNGRPCDYEIGLVEMSSKQLVPVYITDEMGRNVRVKMENSGMTLINISKYKIEEEIYDLQKKEKITTNSLIRRYLKKDNIKMVSSLNNKVVIQNDDEVNLFSFKTQEESVRFIDSLSNYFFKIKRGDCIFVKDVSSAQRKYLFNLLENKGFDKKMLYRKFTTFPRSKRTQNPYLKYQ
jgi:hypothetical protein